MWRVRPYRSVYSVWFEGNLPHVQLITVNTGGEKDEILSPSINKACFIETVIFHYSTWLHIPHTQHNIQDQVERKKWNMEQVWYENGNRSPLDKHNTHTIKPFDKSSMPWSSVKVIKCVVFSFILAQYIYITSCLLQDRKLFIQSFHENFLKNISLQWTNDGNIYCADTKTNTGHTHKLYIKDGVQWTFRYEEVFLMVYSAVATLIAERVMDL